MKNKLHHPTSTSENSMLSLLIKTLPQEFTDIKNAFENEHYPELLQRIHKLHGAICYCNVPDLKNAAAALEGALKKKDYDSLEMLFEAFEQETNRVMSMAASA